MAMYTLLEKVEPSDAEVIVDQLALTAEERQRSFYRCKSLQGKDIKLQLKRGTLLKDGDILSTAADEQGKVIQIQIIAKPEPVLTITASQPIHLLRAAYHLGNRHIALEVQEHYLRLSPDSVLEQMLRAMPVTVTTETVPFHPEAGAYHHHA